MKDRCLKGWTGLEALVLDENLRQLDKWGVQDHDPFEWLVIMAEEFGELNQAILEHNYQPEIVKPAKIVKEAIQTATLCLKIAEMFSYTTENDLDVAKARRG